MWLFVCCGCNINRFLTVFELGMLLLMGNQGGGVIHDVAGDQLYHLYVSRMTNNCSLRHWTKNSRIDHAVSKTSTIESPEGVLHVTCSKGRRHVERHTERHTKHAVCAATVSFQAVGSCHGVRLAVPLQQT